MKVVVILPASEIPAYTSVRIVDLVRRYFPEPHYEHLFTAPAAAAHRYQDSSNRFPREVDVLTDAHTDVADIIVVAQELQHEIPLPDKRTYLLESFHWRVLIRLKNQKIDELDYPEVQAHMFNRFASRLEPLEFFPYGFLFREPAVGGPVDAFGFRIDEDLEALRHRPDRHKLIAVVGGSAAWSWFNFHEETFAKQLEQRLERHLDQRSQNERVTVLNFAQGTSVLLHEILVWILHIERLKPDIVISHDGFNDMIFGMSNDSYLLSRAICAPHLFEEWSKKLHDRDDLPSRVAPTDQIPVVNTPNAIVAAYLERKRQLDRMVKSTGAHHINGLQPAIFSKKPSPLELVNMNNLAYFRPWRDVYERMPHIYDMLSREVAAEKDLVTLDLHRYFQKFGPDETLLQDYMHTTPAGDERIAEAYSQFIIEHGMV